MTIKEIRELSKLSQSLFAKHYEIPLSTLKKWEAQEDNPNHRECPIYVNHLLERVVKEDTKKTYENS